MRFTLASIVLATLSLGFLASCSNSEPDIKREVQAEFDSNPKLRERGFAVRVVRIENGYVTAKIEAGLSPDTAKAINEGKSLNEVYYFTDMSVSPFIETEEILKNKPGIKAVMWTADTLPASPKKAAAKRKPR